MTTCKFYLISIEISFYNPIISAILHMKERQSHTSSCKGLELALNAFSWIYKKSALKQRHRDLHDKFIPLKSTQFFPCFWRTHEFKYWVQDLSCWEGIAKISGWANDLSSGKFAKSSQLCKVATADVGVCLIADSSSIPARRSSSIRMGQKGSTIFSRPCF